MTLVLNGLSLKEWQIYLRYKGDDTHTSIWKRTWVYPSNLVVYKNIRLNYTSFEFV